MSRADSTLDTDRLSALPRLPRDDGEPVFAEPWQAQAFALAVKLSEQGHFSWKEWAAGRVAFGVGPGLGTSLRQASFEGSGVGAGAAAAAGAAGGLGGSAFSPGMPWTTTRCDG